MQTRAGPAEAHVARTPRRSGGEWKDQTVDPWIIAVISFLGGGGGLGGIYALIRHRMNLRFCRDMAEKHGIEGLEAAGRIVHPWAEATKDVKVRRQRRKAEAAKPQPVVQVPRQAIAPSDDAEATVRSGRTAG